MEGIDSMILARTPNKGKCEKLITSQNRGWIAKLECANLKNPKISNFCSRSHNMFRVLGFWN
jgi:hypothetical protein